MLKKYPFLILSSFFLSFFLFSWANSRLPTMTAHLSLSINPLHFGVRTSVVRSFCVIGKTIKLWVCTVHFASGCI